MRGIYSIGTNSTRALVAEFARGRPTARFAGSIGTRVGEGLKASGELTEEAMNRTVEALREHKRSVEALTRDVVAIATSALRRASNARVFEERVRATVGVPLRIIDGDEEARCSFTGALSVVAESQQTRFGVVDPGGGSTEYATGTAQGVDHVVSLEIGAVRLTEAVDALAGRDGPVPDDALDRARQHAAEAMQPVLEAPPVDRLVFVGGTATTAIGLIRGGREPFEAAPLDPPQLSALIRRLARLPLEARRDLAGMNPQRADIIVGGLVLLETVMRLTRHEQATVSTFDLLVGYLMRHGS